MSTGDQRANTYSGKILTSPDFQLRIYDNLKKHSSDFIRNAFSETGGFFSAVALSAGAANDQLTVSEVHGYNENTDFVLPAAGWDDTLVDVDFPNETGETYEVAVHPSEIPASIESNQRTGEIAFKDYEEAIGDRDEPYSVTNNGDVNLTFELKWPSIGGVLDADYAGRTARVWLKLPRSLTEYIEECTVAFTGGTCKITTTGLLGQGGSIPISTDPVDYQILVVGPTIVPFAILADTEWIFIGEFDGNGPAAAPTGFDYTDQKVFGVVEVNYLNILQLARDLYTTPVLDGDGLPNLATPIETLVTALQSDKADKVSGAVSGNFAGLNGSGNLTDSGKKPADYLQLSGGTMTGILNVFSNSKFLEAVGVPEIGAKFTLQGSQTGSAAPYNDFVISISTNLFTLAQVGGVGSLNYYGQSGVIEVPSVGNFLISGGASLKSHPHTGASDGGNIALTSVTGHTKAVHDALGIDADTLDTLHASAFALVANGVTNGNSHDHDGGDGAQIPTGGIVDDAVTADKLRDDASVDANRAVTTNHIRDLAVTETKVSGAVARWIAGGQVAADGSALGRTEDCRVGNITYLTGGAFSGSHADFEVRRAGLGTYELQPPTGTTTSDYMPIFYSRNSVLRHIAQVAGSVTPKWTITFLDNAAAAADADWWFCILKVT